MPRRTQFAKSTQRREAAGGVLGAEHVTFDDTLIAKWPANAPDGTRHFCEVTTLAVKDMGRVFSGRPVEVERIQNQTQPATQKRRKEPARPGVILVGAPGVSKGTLLGPVEEQLTKDGRVSLTMAANELSDGGTFEDAIAEQNGANFDRFRYAVREVVAWTAARGTDNPMASAGGRPEVAVTLEVYPTSDTFDCVGVPAKPNVRRLLKAAGHAQ